MLENSSIQVPATSRPRRRPRLPIEAQARRVEQLRRSFQRVLRRRPTLIEKASMLRAAALVARAEALALDPHSDPNVVVKVNNLASRILRVLNIRLVESAPRKTTPVGLRLARERWAANDEAKGATVKDTNSDGRRTAD
jgi:hypothetical protein